MKNADILTHIRNGRCTVLGYGVSNKPLVSWLTDHGATSVTVRDRRLEETLAASGELNRLREMGVTYIGGPGYLDGLEDAGPQAVIFRTPGLRPDEPHLAAAVAGGATLSSEMELFFDLTDAQVLGVTGSDGKTTTTTLTSLLVSAGLEARGKGRMYLGGNIGMPLLPCVDHMTEDDVAVVELSSFQLMTMTVSPHRAAVTNLSENHLNWHHGMGEYVAAKANILSHPPIRGAVLNADNRLTVSLGQKLPSDLPVTWFSSTRAGRAAVIPPKRLAKAGSDEAVYEEDGYLILEGAVKRMPLLNADCIRLPGRHNLENVMTALALADAYVTPTITGEVVSRFEGVPHRLELILEKNGVCYYNGSIDSTPSRTCAALCAMEDLNNRAVASGQPTRRPPIVICGGRDKHVSFAPLAEALCQKASAVVLTGEARELIMRALQDCPAYSPDALQVRVIADWDEAMTVACRMAEPGDTVLLSPACTSFDAFSNFEERGERFRQIVKTVTSG